MRTIANLLNHDGRVYVYLRSKNIAQKFLLQATQEGFTFADGELPTNREHSDIYALNQDFTLNFVGFVGHMRFHSFGSVQSNPITRIDFGKYVSGSEDYLIQEKS